mgnify:CR=1 FL=1
MKYILTITLWAGDEIVIECQYLEPMILYAETHYGDAMSGWAVTRKDFSPPPAKRGW